MKIVLFFAVVFLVSCSSGYNVKMNDLLKNKKILEDSVKAANKRFLNMPDKISELNLDSFVVEKDTKDYAAGAIADSFRNELKKVNYSIDSLSKLR